MMCIVCCCVSYDTWMTDTDIDADIEPPLEPEGPWLVCVYLSNDVLHNCINE